MGIIVNANKLLSAGIQLYSIIMCAVWDLSSVTYNKYNTQHGEAQRQAGDESWSRQNMSGSDDRYVNKGMDILTLGNNEARQRPAATERCAEWIIFFSFSAQWWVIYFAPEVLLFPGAGECEQNQPVLDRAHTLNNFYSACVRVTVWSKVVFVKKQPKVLCHPDQIWFWFSSFHHNLWKTWENTCAGIQMCEHVLCCVQ